MYRFLEGNWLFNLAFVVRKYAELFHKLIKLCNNLIHSYTNMKNSF